MSKDKCQRSYRIDERFLLAVEHEDADNQQNQCAESTVTQCLPTELTGTESSVFEGLDDGCHGVEKHDLVQRRISDITERIDNRCGVHPERNKDAEEIRQITVFGGQRRDNESESQGYALDECYQHREKEDIPVRAQMNTLENKEQIDDDKRTELQRETEHLGYHHRDGRNESREIDLTKQISIGLERIRHRRQALGEILPKANTGEVEHRLRDIISRYAGNAAKHDDIHEHREKRRDEIPPHAEDRLLELNRDITLDKQPDQVALLP